MAIVSVKMVSMGINVYLVSQEHEDSKEFSMLKLFKFIVTIFLQNQNWIQGLNQAEISVG